MKKVSLTKSMTLAMRMTEMAIATHLTTSVRMVMRPIFQEVDIFEEQLKYDKEVILQSMSIKVSFDHNNQSVRMSCYCVTERDYDREDWHPVFVQLFDTEGTPGGNELGIFQFDQAGHIQYTHK